jgi:hypothetical protein
MASINFSVNVADPSLAADIEKKIVDIIDYITDDPRNNEQNFGQMNVNTSAKFGVPYWEAYPEVEANF